MKRRRAACAPPAWEVCWCKSVGEKREWPCIVLPSWEAIKTVGLWPLSKPPALRDGQIVVLFLGSVEGDSRYGVCARTSTEPFLTNKNIPGSSALNGATWNLALAQKQAVQLLKPGSSPLDVFSRDDQRGRSSAAAESEAAAADAEDPPAPDDDESVISLATARSGGTSLAPTRPVCRAELRTGLPVVVKYDGAPGDAAWYVRFICCHFHFFTGELPEVFGKTPSII